MLKWLRKYNSIILVVGGSLLMVAFLLPETIMQLGRTPLGGAPLKINGDKVSYGEYEKAQAEYYAITALLGRDMGAMLGAGESVDHWIMLTREARQAGFTGGKLDGQEFLPEIARSIATQESQFRFPPVPIDQRTDEIMAVWTTSGIPQIISQARINEDAIYRAFGKLHAVARMRAAYYSAATARFSRARMVTGMKELVDSAKADMLFVPPEREFANIPEPDDAAIQAHFNKFKDTKPGEGPGGIGYLLPDRIKLAWMTVDRAAIATGVTPDVVEVRKRYLRKHPGGGTPTTDAERQELAQIENEVRVEETDRIVKAMDQAVRAEFERAVRKLESDGDYKKLPADWADQRPDFERLRDTVASRVQTMTGLSVPPPAVTIRDAGWLTQAEVSQLPEIGGAILQRGSRTVGFPQVAFSVRELAGNNEFSLQAGVPAMESVTDMQQKKFYFMVLAAKKESPPDSPEEIREMVVRDIKRLAAFEKLKEQVGAFQLLAETPEGLTAVSNTGAPSEGEPLPIKRDVRVDSSGMTPSDPNLNHDVFRDAIGAAASKLDPTADIAAVDLFRRTVVTPIEKSLGLGVARITAVAPMTVEDFRRMQGRAAQELIRRDDTLFTKEDPFSLKNMRERLNVEFTGGQQVDTEKKSESETEPGTQS